MPYIEEDRREEIFNDGLSIPEISNGGDLNFLITLLCAYYMKQHGLRYKNISDVIGALEGAKREFQRKVVDPYEVIKERENGTVYEDIHEIRCMLARAK